MEQLDEPKKHNKPPRGIYIKRLLKGTLTLSKTSLTLASDSPNHMVNSSGPLMEMKLAWHSLAIALARSVFPQPGGP